MVNSCLQDIVPDGDADQDATHEWEEILQPAEGLKMTFPLRALPVTPSFFFRSSHTNKRTASKDEDRFSRNSKGPSRWGRPSVTVLHQRRTGDVVHLAATGSIASGGKPSCSELAAGHPKKGSSPLPMWPHFRCFQSGHAGRHGPKTTIALTVVSDGSWFSSRPCQWPLQNQPQCLDPVLLQCNNRGKALLSANPTG